jgi:hypothetical protein
LALARNGTMGFVVPMHTYRRAWLFTGWMMLVFVTTPIWLFGWLQQLGEPFFLLGGMVWVMHGLAALMLFRCEDCGTSLFRTGPSFMPFYTPWPHRRCRECGHDVAEANGR